MTYVPLGIVILALAALYLWSRHVQACDRLLYVLRHNAPQALTGLQLVHMAGVGRGVVYVELARLEGDGLIASRERPDGRREFWYVSERVAA